MGGPNSKEESHITKGSTPLKGQEKKYESKLRPRNQMVCKGIPCFSSSQLFFFHYIIFLKNFPLILQI